MHFFILSVCCIATDCSWQWAFDKKWKSCTKSFDLVTADGLYDQKDFYKMKIYFYLLFKNQVTQLPHFGLIWRKSYGCGVIKFL